MRQDPVRAGWRSLLRREWIPTLAVLLGGVLLQSMNVLMLTTVLPSIVGELGGVAMLSWPTTAFLASSIVAASCAGMLAAVVGARAAYCAGVTTFGLGALLCSLATTMGWIVAGRLIQGIRWRFGGGRSLCGGASHFPGSGLVTDDCIDVDQLEHVRLAGAAGRRNVRPLRQLAQRVRRDRDRRRHIGRERLRHLAA
jgi:hypothetical protein